MGRLGAAGIGLCIIIRRRGLVLSAEPGVFEELFLRKES